MEPHDLVKFGLIPELIGRLPVITVLDDLDEDALVRVLKEPRNSLVKQYKELLSMDNVELEFTDEALHAIARKTIERKTGARGLRSVMESILLPIMYDVPTTPPSSASPWTRIPWRAAKHIWNTVRCASAIKIRLP